VISQLHLNKLLLYLPGRGATTTVLAHPPADKSWVMFLSMLLVTAGS